MPHSDTLVNGVKYPSVTEICGIIDKPFLKKWYGKYGTKLCERKMQAAAAVGTEFHDLVSRIVNGVTVEPKTRRLKGMCESFTKWYDGAGFVPEVQEFKVISERYKYAGTLDAIGHFGDGTLVLVDWKSSSSIYPEMAYQLAAYAKAYQEQTGLEINTGWIVQVDKDRPFKVHTKSWSNLDSKFEVFKALLTVYSDLRAKKG